jgi:glycosyltransferase involved in cell wall biosynthesis
MTHKNSEVMTNSPMVDVAFVTYNHEKYIAQAIESVLMQQTDFKVRMIIGDDCSTDKTQEIIRKYAQKYPYRIKTILLSEHLGLLHKNRVGIQVLKLCTAKYIALLDGDDYWTDPNKLQKQVDFLENNPDFSICFHNVNVIYEGQSKEIHPFHLKELKSIFTLEDVITSHFIPTCSTMFRARLFSNFPDWFYAIPMGDWLLHVLNAEHGNVGYINEILGVYRVHEGGIWSLRKKADVLKETIRAAHTINAYLGFRYNKIIKKKISQLHYAIAHILIRENNIIGAVAHGFKSFITLPFAKNYSRRPLLGCIKRAIRNKLSTKLKSQLSRH